MPPHRRSRSVGFFDRDGVLRRVNHPPIRFVPRVAGDLLSPITLGLLPARLRAGYGLPWDRKRRLAFELAERVIRTALPLLPQVARAMPHARRAA